MAQRVILADDLDGQESTEDKPVLTWQFGLGPRNNFKTYTVDLREENYAKLEQALAPFLENAVQMEEPSRIVRSSAPRRTSTPKTNDKGYSAADVRAWAETDDKFKGKVSARGRIHREVIEAYEYAKGLDKK